MALAVTAITTALEGLGVTTGVFTDNGVTDNGVTDSGVTGLDVTDPVDGGGGGDGDDDDDDVDTTVIIVICVIIGLLLLVFIVALCKYMEMRRRDGKEPVPSTSSSSDRDYQEYPPAHKSSIAKFQSSFTHQEPYVAAPAFNRASGIDRRSSKRTSFKEPERGGAKVYSIPLHADVTLPRQQNGGPYGVVIGDIGKKTGAPTYSQDVQGTLPSPNQHYSSLPYSATGQHSVTSHYQPPSASVSTLPSNGTVYQRADGFTVFEPPQAGRASSLTAPVPTGPIVPTQADIYYQGGAQGQAYSDYETVSHVNVNP